MLFIDTCYLLSLINVMEINHNKAIQLLEYIDKEETLINSKVLFEMFNIHLNIKLNSIKKSIKIQ